MSAHPLRWWCAGASLVALAIFAVYGSTASRLAAPAYGRTAMGLAVGILCTAIMVFEAVLGLRKRRVAWPLGRLTIWLEAHIWLGMLTVPLLIWHSGFRWGTGLTGGLMWVFAIVFASGIFGMAVQRYLPRRMTELVKLETVFSQIPLVVQRLRDEADKRVQYVTGGLEIQATPAEQQGTPSEPVLRASSAAPKKREPAEKAEADLLRRLRKSPAILIDPLETSQLRDHYLQEIRPYLSPRPASRLHRHFQTPEAVDAYFEHLKVLLPDKTHAVLDDLKQICEERRQLLVQRQLHLWLHGWLAIHVPLSFLMLLLIVGHILQWLAY